MALLVQIGSPTSPGTKDVKRYLRAFLGNRRVVDSPHPLLWWPLLNFIVLPLRAYKSALLYSRIWDGEEFPLIKFTNSFAHKVDCYLDKDIAVRPCYILSSPSVSEQLNLCIRDGAEEFSKVIVLPQFPQYSEATTALVFDLLCDALRHKVHIPHFEFFDSYYNLESFIVLSAQKIDRAIRHSQERGEVVDGLVLSFHGLPLRRVVEKGDPYHLHCQETFNLIRKRISSVPQEKVYCTFQSRFGREKWLAPATDDFVRERISKQGDCRLAVYAPSFVVDCLETLDELGYELQKEAQRLGGNILFVNCLNDDDQWAVAYAEYLKTLTRGNGNGS